MRLELYHPDNEPIEPAKDLMVVVACEDSTTAPRACALLERVAHNAGEEGRLIYSWWTFGVLESPALRELAAREAAGADMIMVAGREAQGLPGVVTDWLRLWLAREVIPLRRRALVALLESYNRENGSRPGVLRELEDLAKSSAVDFFANENAAGLDPAQALRSVPQDAVVD